MILVSTLLVVTWLKAPVRRLTELADIYNQGQLDLKRRGVERNDEIGQLSQTIERLCTGICLAMNWLQIKKS